MIISQKLRSLQRFFPKTLSKQKIKQNSFEFLKKTIFKIQSFIKLILPTLFFLACSIYVLEFAPSRFFLALGITLLLKIHSKKDEVIITTANQALNIIGNSRLWIGSRSLI